MRKCSYCAEEIKEEAIKCKHCGSMLTMYSSESSQKTRDEKLLVASEVKQDKPKSFRLQKRSTPGTNKAPGPIKRFFSWYMIVFYFVIFLVVFGIIGGIKDNNRFSLEITSPRDGLATTETQVVVTGKADLAATLSLNNTEIKNDKGEFEYPVNLVVGENKITVTAMKEGELKNTLVILVNRDVTEEEYKLSAQEIPYGELEKNPDKYSGRVVHYQGEIFNIKEEKGQTMIQMNVTDKGYDIWSDQVMVIYDGTTKFVDDDIINVYGEIKGNHSYKSAIGAELTVPLVKAKYITD